MAEVYVATTTALVNYDEHTKIKKDVTRVHAGHPLLEMYPQYFKPADEDVRFAVEVRGTGDGTVIDPESTSPWAEVAYNDLQAEIAKRNEGRDEDAKIKPASRSAEDLRAALDADDIALAAAANDGSGD